MVVRGGDNELGVITGQMRRKLSTVIMKSQVDCLSARLHMAGEGGTEANKRRARADREEVEMDRDRRAMFLSRVRGHGPTRHGQIHL